MNRRPFPSYPTQPLSSAPQSYVQQGQLAHVRGDLAQAERLYRQALAQDRRHGPALHMLGVLAAQQGQHAAAVELLRQAARVLPQDFAVHNNLGNAQHKLGRFADALRSLERALALAPASHRAQVLNNLGNALQGLGRYAEAIQRYQEALELAPQHAECMANLAKALLQSHRAAEALQWAERAAALAPDRPAPHIAKGWALFNLGQPSEAALAVGQWLAQDDRHAEAQFLRGLCAGALERMDLAYPALERAYALDPALPGLVEALAHAAARAGRHERASELAAQLRVDGRAGRAGAWIGALAAQQMTLDWADYDEVRQQARAALPAVSGGMVNPFMVLHVWDDGALQREVAQRYAQAHGLTHVVPANEAFKPAAQPSQRSIRVAYLSADFRQHPTAMLACPVWEAHDRCRFEWIGVYMGPPLQEGADPWHERARAAFDRFEVIIGLSDEEAVQRLRALEIDIAVDLMGYTRYARPGVLAARVAPVQAAWLGYPGTTGMPAIDYLIADRWVAPRDAWGEFTEQVVWLPTTYQANGRDRRPSQITPSRAQVGLPEQAVVLACFNNPAKIQPETFACWMEILRRVPNAVLWLLAGHEGVEHRLRQQAVQAGLEPTRVVLAPKVNHPDHLARHQLADLFLDTWPYNAHTTAADALWMGLPVLTRRGHAFAGRVAESLLHAVGLPELVAADEADYIERAVALATSAQQRQRLRERLLQARLTSPLFDAKRRARELEAAFCMMHEQRQRGLPPQPLQVE
ncbi:UDP-glucose:protein N-beta-glucosyltransferase [Tepidimonas alkaliphilus]|uniref:protein O-GlcNAc transferase n=1 Tax=Tepidimonas alkaliphilus TaxID=2588942 RepID=A0A554W9F2_9BURK|nr:tetratricopeptide repeat protein [Tepidimonas alkaliphilus]TSE20201.1 UDP-glucose:protein N-beta-glucosyltransferase [Tepidimonas alkaliphilus]